MFRELVENSEDVNIVTDENFRIRYISSSISKIFGVEPVSLLGRDICEFVGREKVESWNERLEEGSSLLKDEIVLKTKTGQKVYLDIHVSNFLSRFTVRGLVLKLNDITEKKNRELELVRANQQLDQVIYKTTHDLKAPILSALGLVKLAEQVPDHEKGLYIGLIKKSLLKLDSFIEEMNDFFRNGKLAVQRERISVLEILHDEQELLKNLAQENSIDISINVDEDVEWFSDRVRVRTILTNIFSNAIKYSDPNKPNRFIRISGSVTPEYCDICFFDNGIGIPSEYHEKVFDLFFRATDQSNGTGLGLFIVKDTVERLNGLIELHSKPGEGSMFKVRIPNQLHQPQLVD